MVGAAVWLEEKSAARARAFPFQSRRDSGFSKSWATAAPIPAQSSGANTCAPRPATSGRDPAFDVTTAQPQDIASKTGNPKPSYNEGIRKACACRKNALNSDR